MNFIQSYFNHSITRNDINHSGGYLSSVVNWLSMAYSCLLLKKHNPKHRLIFYGNETMVYLFEKLFQLPYDEFIVVKPNNVYGDLFYCWPKITTYARQVDPFIHIDTDIFMWTSMPKRLVSASLVAQHLEHDSTFYIDVYQQMQDDKINLPEFVNSCYDGKYISSYNAGLLGGNNLEFIKRYLYEINCFLSKNINCISHSERSFLYNVVFEQWLFYGLARKENIEVSTYYKNIITDFDMKKNKVTQQVFSMQKLKYMHVMEYKSNIRCNRFIVYKMQSEFPNQFDEILAVCKDNGINDNIFTSFTYNDIQLCNILNKRKHSKGTFNLSCNEIKDIDKLDSIKIEFLLSFQNMRNDILHKQMRHYDFLELCKIDKNNMHLKTIELSPYIRVVDCNSRLIESLLPKINKSYSNDTIIILLYNSIFNKVDEFIWSRSRFEFLKSLIANKNCLPEFLKDSSRNHKIRDVSNFIKECLFDGIIMFN